MAARQSSMGHLTPQGQEATRRAASRTVSTSQTSRVPSGIQDTQDLRPQAAPGHEHAEEAWCTFCLGVP